MTDGPAAVAFEPRLAVKLLLLLVAWCILLVMSWPLALGLVLLLPVLWLLTLPFRIAFVCVEAALALLRALLFLPARLLGYRGRAG